jgi:hypothetical protein
MGKEGGVEPLGEWEGDYFGGGLGLGLSRTLMYQATSFRPNRVILHARLALLGRRRGKAADNSTTTGFSGARQSGLLDKSLKSFNRPFINLISPVGVQESP